MPERSFQESFVRLLAEVVAKSQPVELVKVCRACGMGRMNAKEAIRLAAVRGRWIEAHHEFNRPPLAGSE